MPVGIYGTVWAYLKLRETRPRTGQVRIDWWGNISFAAGLSAILIASTYGIQPYGGHVMGSTNPWVLAGLIGGALGLIVFVLIERRVSAPVVNLALFRIRAFSAGASSLPSALEAGLLHAGLPHATAAKLAGLPPVSSMFGALLGINPIHHLLSQNHALHDLSPAGRQALTGRAFFPDLISAPFHDGLDVVFATAAGLSAVAAVASLMHGTTPPQPKEQFP